MSGRQQVTGGVRLRRLLFAFPLRDQISIQRFSEAVRAPPDFALRKEWGSFELRFIFVEEVGIWVGGVAQEHEREEGLR